jgi:hypothetical protein
MEVGGKGASATQTCSDRATAEPGCKEKALRDRRTTQTRTSIPTTALQPRKAEQTHQSLDLRLADVRWSGSLGEHDRILVGHREHCHTRSIGGLLASIRQTKCYNHNQREKEIII